MQTADEIRRPHGDTVVVDEGPGDQGAHGADGTEGEVQHPRRPVEHDDADARQRVDTAQRQAGDDVGVEVLRS
jgi:hypothetical protein